MSSNAWLPIKYEIQPYILTGPVLYSSEKYQILEATGQANRILISIESLGLFWLHKGFTDESQISPIKFGDDTFFVLTSDERMLMPLSEAPKPDNKEEAIGLAAACKRARQKDSSISLGTSIYVEKFAMLLPVPGLDQPISDDVVIGRYLTGGVAVSCHSTRRLVSLMPYLEDHDLKDIWDAAGIPQELVDDTEVKKSDQKRKKEFALSGRKELEMFFKDHVIDIIENKDRYSALGINFPSAIVLHGPPGCGKTFAVETLVSYLDWPCFTIDSSSIGSPYIHETGRKIAQTFEKAMEQAPSIMIIDEMEAFLTKRDKAYHEHKIEEIAEFLRRIPEATKKNVLIIAMTNRIEMIDPAILRRGRFDHVIAVDMPSAEEVESLLIKLFKERPCEEGLNISEAVKVLTGNPLSDLAFLVQETARLAAKSGRNKIDSDSLSKAINTLRKITEEKEKEKRKIGF